MLDKPLAYTLADLRSVVQDDLNDPSFNSTRLTRYLNRGQQLIFNTHMFKFCEKSVSGPLTIGQYTFDQQTDWQTTFGGVVYDSAVSNRVILKLDADSFMNNRDFFDLYPTPDKYPNAAPLAWTELGKQIYFQAPVDKAYVFKERYYRIPTDMSADSDVPDVPVEFRELLEAYALYRGEKQRGNHDVAATYKQQFEDGLENMVLRYAETTQVDVTVMRSARSAQTYL